MLTLSQSQSQQHVFSGGQQYPSSFGNHNASVNIRAVNGDGNRHHSGLPLTPPGSPEEKKLVIATPVKTPCQPSVNFQHDYGVDGQPSSLDLTTENATNSTLGADSTVGTSDYSSAPASQYYGLMAPFLNGDCLDGVNPNALFNSALIGQSQSSSLMSKRSRMEKRPIPLTLKDDRYYERRRRNNLAAKRSRDTRKEREDSIALKAARLERENAVLRAEIMALREQHQNMRNMMIQRQIRMQQSAGTLG